MAEIKYESSRKWLDAAAEKRAGGQKLIQADDYQRRLFAFVDEEGDIHFVSVSHVYQTVDELEPAEKEALQEPGTRRALVEEGTT